MGLCSIGELYKQKLDGKFHKSVMRPVMLYGPRSRGDKKGGRRTKFQVDEMFLWEEVGLGLST